MMTRLLGSACRRAARGTHCALIRLSMLRHRFWIRWHEETEAVHRAGGAPHDTYTHGRLTHHRAYLTLDHVLLATVRGGLR